MPKANARGWWRDYFTDHAGLRAKLPEAYTGVGQSAKDKVYCMKTLAYDVAVLGLGSKSSLYTVKS
jgi:hypothetical protein